MIRFFRMNMDFFNKHSVAVSFKAANGAQTRLSGVTIQHCNPTLKNCTMLHSEPIFATNFSLICFSVIKV